MCIFLPSKILLKASIYLYSISILDLSKVAAKGALNPSHLFFPTWTGNHSVIEPPPGTDSLIFPGTLC